MSKISKEGYEQIAIIKMHLIQCMINCEASGKFNDVKDEFEAIAGIVQLSGTWEEVE